jgi:carbon monoxide dehydrogenase subunit G
MAEIEVSVEISAPIDKVWNIISDIDNESKFWKGTKEIRNISKNDNIITREITIAFRDQKCMQEVKLQPKEKIEFVFTKGIIDGIKIMTLTLKDEKTLLKVKWDIKLTGMMGMFTGMIKKHIESGTVQALQKIKEEIER